MAPATGETATVSVCRSTGCWLLDVGVSIFLAQSSSRSPPPMASSSSLPPSGRHYCRGRVSDLFEMFVPQASIWAEVEKVHQARASLFRANLAAFCAVQVPTILKDQAQGLGDHGFASEVFPPPLSEHLLAQFIAVACVILFVRASLQGAGIRIRHVWLKLQ